MPFRVGDPFESAPKELGGLAGGLGSQAKFLPEAWVYVSRRQRVLQELPFCVFNLSFIVKSGHLQIFEQTFKVEYGTFLVGLPN